MGAALVIALILILACCKNVHISEDGFFSAVTGRTSCMHPCKSDGNGCGHLYSMVLLHARHLFFLGGERMGWDTDLTCTPPLPSYICCFVFSTPRFSAISDRTPSRNNTRDAPTTWNATTRYSAYGSWGKSCARVYASLCSHLCA